MTPLVLVQIGDVHFPDMETQGPAVDLKDQAVSPLLVGISRPDRLRNSLRELLRVLDQRRKEIMGLLICGDLTSRGQIEGYGACLEYLNNCLQFSDARKWRPDQIHAVPGNHDVNRAACDPAGVNVFQKFTPLEDAWQKVGVPVLSTRDARETRFESGPHNVAVFSLNSCVGCGERRSLPASIRDDLQNLLKPYINSNDGAKAFELVGETLDTPAFTEDHITGVISAIQALPSETLPVMLAHHNLLPQALVRVEIYTEVINGGLVRSRLTATDRPVIYCHGHIHRDPIEIVSDPLHPGSKIVSVSAPQLVDGFNLIEIHFSRSNTPIGCKVLPYRTSVDHGGASLQPSIRVPLQSARHARLNQDELTKAVGACLQRDFMTFAALREAVTTARNGSQPNVKSLAQSIEDLFWLGLVDIHDHDENSRVWQVRRIQP